MLCYPIDNTGRKVKIMTKKILVACEESQTVTLAFRALGAEAFSCDIQGCSGGHPEWHVQQDVRPMLQGNCSFRVTTGEQIHVETWDLIIAHPPCTYLSSAGNAWFNEEKYGEKARERKVLREEALQFFMACIKANSMHICVENPLGYPCKAYKPATQIIQPYMFGDAYRKRTLLWLKGLPTLKATEVLPLEMVDTYWYQAAWNYDAATRKRIRSKTFPGIAEAMASQWLPII